MNRPRWPLSVSRPAMPALAPRPVCVPESRGGASIRCHRNDLSRLEPLLHIDPPLGADRALALDAGRDRSRMARRTAVLGTVYQGVFAVVQLVCLALLARHTSRDVFGLWMTVLALTSWAPMAYFGQPAAMLTKLGAVARSDEAAAQRLFTASSAIVLGTTALLIAILLCATPWLSWAGILNASAPATASLAQGTALMAIGVALLANPATISNFALLAHQRGDIVHATMIAASFIGLLAFSVGVWAGQPLWIIGALMLCGPLLGGIALWLVVAFGRLARMPQWRTLDGSTVRSMAVIGLHFVAIDVATMAIVRTPDLIVAQLHGPAAVAIFSAVGRLPMLMLAVFQAILLPYWPALGEALYRSDNVWVRRVTAKSLRVVLAIGAVSAVVLAALGGPFIRVWLGTDDAAITPLVGAACLQALAMGMLAWFGVLFGALSMFRQLATLFAATATLFLPLAIAMGHALGPLGVALAQASTLLLFTTPIGSWLLRRRTTQVMDGRPSQH